MRKFNHFNDPNGDIEMGKTAKTKLAGVFQVLYTQRKEKKIRKSNKNAVILFSRLNHVVCSEHAGFHYVEYALFSPGGYNRITKNWKIMLCFT
jgi:hypothetical protein